MDITRFKLIIGAGLSACAFGTVPATANAAEVGAPGPCVKNFCPLDEAQHLVNEAFRIVNNEYDEFEAFYEDVEDDLNVYLCRQTGDPTYCNNTGG